MKQDRCYTKTYYEGEEGGCTIDGIDEVDHCFLTTLASRLSESASATQGTSVAENRTQPVSVWYILLSEGDGTLICLRVGGTRTVAINNPITNPAATQRSSIIIDYLHMYLQQP